MGKVFVTTATTEESAEATVRIVMDGGSEITIESVDDADAIISALSYGFLETRRLRRRKRRACEEFGEIGD